MLAVIGRRLALAVPILAIVSLLTFLLVPFLPGDPAATILGDGATPDQLAAVRERLGLDLPILERYGLWLTSALQGDLGRSYFSSQPVAEVVAGRVGVTLSLAIAATVLTVVVGVTAGALAAVRGGALDRVAQILVTLGMSVPSFWLGLVIVLVFAIWLRMLPPSGYVDFFTDPGRWSRYILLPSIALAAGATAAVALQTRAALLGLMNQEFVRALRAKGISTRRIVWDHLLRNAAGPIVAVVGLQFITMLGNVVVIEQVFGLPGLGSLIFESVNRLDLPLMQALVLVMALLVVVVNLISDVVVAWLNPKVR
jgi:peptide/nickel transport system permease protein